MSYKNQEDFVDELLSEFDIEQNSFLCYTLESNPQIRVILFRKRGTKEHFIGLLTNNHFHIIGLGVFSCMNEDAKALCVALTCTIPQEEQRLKISARSLFNEEEQVSIIEKIKQVF